MAVDSDESLLPTPPPPRPAARQAAVETALRRFDGSKETSIGSKDRERRSPNWWAGMNRRPVGALVTAALVAAVGIPAAMIALRDQTIAPRADDPRAAQPEQSAAADSNPPSASMQAEPAEQPVPAEPPKLSKPSNSEPMSLAPAARNASPADQLEVLDHTPALMAAPAAAPPPPPPPPPASPEPQVAEEAGSQEIVLTGTRVARSDVQKREKRERAGSVASSVAVNDSNGEFLSRLQTAVRANDKGAVVRLVGLPLRVNFDAGAKTYSDPKSIERDFELIFTSRVRHAILNQRADQLFTNYKGAMVGAGEVWFDSNCGNSSCSRKGPVRIKAVNP